jgi:membrane-associated phospholipid phosphatase
MSNLEFFKNDLSRRSIILCFAIFVLLFFLLLSQLEKGQLVLFFNARYTDPISTFFKYFTHLGEGILFVPIILLSLLYRYKAAVTLASMGIFLGVTTAFLKQIVYTDNYRPKRYFDGIVELNFVPGVDIHGLNSFPSGHTATAAAIAIWFALEFRTKSALLSGIIYVLLVAISRVYLAQHFLIDVTFGMLEGFVISVMCFFAVKRIFAQNQKLESHMSF